MRQEEQARGYLDPRDSEYAATLSGDERDVVVSTVARYRRADRLRVADPLPAGELLRLSDGHPVALESLVAGRPLVLVFGSFTWPPFRRRSGDVESLYERFRDRAAIVFVYIAEAHSTDGWQLQSNLDEDVLIAQHASLEERFAAARAGVARLGLTMPVFVDAMDNAVSDAYSAWPERIYVIDADWRVAFTGGPGPFEFDPDAAADALETLV